jgi:hypothetical protein
MPDVSRPPPESGIDAQRPSGVQSAPPTHGTAALQSAVHVIAALQ